MNFSLSSEEEGGVGFKEDDFKILYIFSKKSATSGVVARETLLRILSDTDVEAIETVANHVDVEHEAIM